MRLYNTATLRTEEFQPLRGNEVDMYVCGPTVYNYIHIGNARPIVIFDTLRRVLEADGYTVKYVSNFTDVDDKIINKALEENVPETEIASRYMKAYTEVRDALHTEKLYDTPQVTKTMREIIDFIRLLVEKGNAYVVDGDVFFSVDSVEGYGSLSHQNPKDLEVGARVDENSKKRNGLDFALWKKTEKGIRWDSPWGKGRPGWHTECVVMIDKDFDHQEIDIHGGGKDLRFPHHENENAQNIAAKGKPLAHFWVHNGMISVDGQKMSKSLGNTIWAKDVLDQWGADLTRWFLLSARYRDTLDYSEKALEECRRELDKVNGPIRRAGVLLQLENAEESGEIEEESWKAFLDAMNDDLNTPNAYAVMYRTAGSLNQALRAGKKDFGLIRKKRNSLEKMKGVLGLTKEEVILDEEDRRMYADWQKARSERDFARADQLRAALTEKGVL